MKKDHLRDYATEAFRYYARLGKTFEELKEEIYKEAIEKSRKTDLKTNNICSPTELAMMRADKAVVEKKGELEDILAVEETLKQLVFMKNGDEIKKAIELVYFSEPNREYEKGEFSDKVRYAAEHIPCSERNVYYYLNKARRLFSENRGLRASNMQFNNKKDKVCSSRG